MPIRILPPELAARIAAGEVVERPVSVVKELLENSIDAGASQVTAEIRGGGTSLIRVADDGEGIPADELPLAFLRHATSKLTSSEQLDRVSTPGVPRRSPSQHCRRVQGVRLDPNCGRDRGFPHGAAMG